jgi:hypothetical protein
MAKKSRRQATRPLHERIALIFDYDATLAPSSIDAVLERLGHEPEEFRRTRIKRLIEEERFEAVMAGFYAFVQESRGRKDGKVTRALFEEVGRGIEPFPGVREMFGRVREWAEAVVPGIEVEFYVVTSGHEEIHKATPIAGEFKEIWGSEFHFDENGEVAFPRRILTFQEKQQYVLQIAKGTSAAGPNSPEGAYRPLPEDEFHVPLDQVIYLGDGGSDLPVFELLNDHGGIAIAVSKAERAEDWASLSKMRPGRRVENVAGPADYREGSELLRSMQLAVESICKLVALRQLARHE